MSRSVKTKSSVIYIIIILSIASFHPIEMDKTALSTTESYKDELFNAAASIYRILKNHQPNASMSAKLQSFNEEQIAQSVRKNSNLLKKPGINEDLFTEKLAELSSPRILEENKRQRMINDKLKSRQLDIIGNNILFEKKRKLAANEGEERMKKKSIILPNRDIEEEGLEWRFREPSIISELNSRNKLSRIPVNFRIKKLPHHLSHIDSLNQQSRRELKYPKLDRKYKITANSATNFASNSLSSSMFKSNSALKAKMRSNFPVATTYGAKALSTAKNLGADHKIFTKNKHEKYSFPIVKTDSKSITIVQKFQKLNKPNIAMDTVLMKKEKYKQKNPEVGVESSNIIHHDNYSSNEKKLPNNNSATIVKQNVALSTRRATEKLDIIISQSGMNRFKNATEHTATVSSSYFSFNHNLTDANFRNNIHFANRKERVIEDSENKTLPVYPMLADVSQDIARFIGSHIAAFIAILSGTVLLLFLIVIMLVCHRMKRHKRKDDDELLVAKMNGSKGKKQAMKSKSGFSFFKRKKEQNKTGCNNSFPYSPITREEEDALFSICSEDDSLEEEITTNWKDNGYKFKRCGSSNKSEKQNEFNIQQTRSALKTSENPHRKLLKLHSNFSTRTGNVCYTDVLKRAKESPKLESSFTQEEFTKKLPVSILYEDLDGNNEYSDSDSAISGSECNSSVKDVNDSKNSVLEIENNSKQRDVEDFDPNNPFHEGFEEVEF